jgi:hypothetical protein
MIAVRVVGKDTEVERYAGDHQADGDSAWIVQGMKTEGRYKNLNSSAKPDSASEPYIVSHSGHSSHNAHNEVLVFITLHS